MGSINSLNVNFYPEERRPSPDFPPPYQGEYISEENQISLTTIQTDNTVSFNLNSVERPPSPVSLSPEQGEGSSQIDDIRNTPISNIPEACRETINPRTNASLSDNPQDMNQQPPTSGYQFPDYPYLDGNYFNIAFLTCVALAGIVAFGAAKHHW